MLAAKGVVIAVSLFSLFNTVGWVERSETHQPSLTSAMGIASLNPSYGLGYSLGLFDFFTQHFKFQPFVLCLLQILLRFCKCIRGLIEFLAIFLVEIGIVKVPLLFCDFRLPFGNRLGQCFQRMLFVEIEPALRGA